MKHVGKIFARLFLTLLLLGSILAAPAIAADADQDKVDELVNNPLLRLLGTPAESAWTPQVMEKQYDEVWTDILLHYFDRSQLAAWGDWRHKYDGKLKSLTDLDVALDTMVSSLNNRWTTYVGKQTTGEMTSSFENNVTLGIWASKQDDGSYQVYYLEYDSPAYRSSLRKGDRIVSINGKQLKTLSTMDVQALFVGKVGEERQIVFKHDGITDQVKLTIAVYGQTDFEIRRLEGNVLYIRPPAFDAEKMKAFMEKLLAVFATPGQRIDKIVLNLRGNLGGYTTLVKPLAELFMKEGLVYTLRLRDGNETTTELKRIMPALPSETALLSDAEKRERDCLQNAEMVVMSDSSTGSSAEILLQALTAAGRAKSFGTRTMGKSIAYEDEQLNNGGMLRMAKGEFTTADGKSWNDIGLEPQIKVEQPRGATTDVQLAFVLAYLSRSGR